MTYPEFVDAINSRLNTNLLATALSVMPAGSVVPPISFMNTNNPIIPAKSVPFRVQFRNTTGVEKQKTMGGAGRRRFEVNGTFYAQIYGAAGVPSSAATLAALAHLVQSYFSGVSEPNGVWYRDITIQEQPATADWFSVRVGGKYTYDRLG